VVEKLATGTSPTETLLDASRTKGRFNITADAMLGRWSIDAEYQPVFWTPTARVKRARYKIETYDIVNLVNGRPEIGRIVHLTFFSKEKGPDGPYHSFVRVILRGTTAIYVKDR